MPAWPNLRSGRGPGAVVLACVLAGTIACQPGHGGTLEPTSGQQTGPDGPYGGGSVSLVSNRLEIRVSGNWRTSRGTNSFDLYAAYHNLGDRPVVLNAATFVANRGNDRGETLQVVDMTGVDLADDRQDNDDATQVINQIEGRKQGTIRIAPGERRLLAVSAYLPDGAADLDDDQKVTVFVPTVRGGGQAIFTTDSSWF